jgi:uncharacterized protein YndB with AHSA1/START domain
MAVTHAEIDAPPERVFEVLSDPQCYADWVVGAHSIRGADPFWPALGTRFYHRVGAWPTLVRDHTEVIGVEPPSHLRLHAHARPLGTAIVDLRLAPSGREGTHVTMTETAGDLLSHIGLNPLTDWLVDKRNVEALRRLRRIAETGVVRT